MLTRRVARFVGHDARGDPIAKELNNSRKRAKELTTASELNKKLVSKLSQRVHQRTSD
jgi:hypothetical protein